MVELTVYIKAAGASMGSLIAVVFKPGGDPLQKLLSRFVIGAILGFISAPLIIDFFGWQHAPDYWLAAATMGGLLGYLTLQLVFSKGAIDLAKDNLGINRRKKS